MPRGEYVSFPMILENVVLGLITTTADIADRLNLPSTLLEMEVPGTNRRTKSHERKVYDNSGAEQSEATANVDAVVRVYTPDKNRINSGKKIKVPSGFRSVPTSVTGDAATRPNAGTARLMTLNFPHGRSNYQIARWMTLNIPESRRPAYFITPAGKKRRTSVAAAPAQTAGETNPNPTAP